MSISLYPKTLKVELTKAVADIPVKDTVVKVDIVTLPTEDAAESPLTGTPISVTTDPREDAAETPAG